MGHILPGGEPQAETGQPEFLGEGFQSGLRHENQVGEHQQGQAAGGQEEAGVGPGRHRLLEKEDQGESEQPHENGRNTRQQFHRQAEPSFPTPEA